MINFNIPYLSESELVNINETVKKLHFQGNGEFSKKAENYLSNLTGTTKIFLNASGTQALEMSGLLMGIQKDDEIIMPSYTFSSTANAFIMRGARIKFIDIHPEDMNMDENQIEDAITTKTKAIVPVHYGGVSCNMDKLMRIAHEFDLKVIEDSAQCINSYYKDKHLGTIGDVGIFSFHETKNIQCGEGGATLINNKAYYDKSEILIEKGTNRTRFVNGEIDHYTWVDIGSSFLVNEITAAFLYSQLKDIDKVTKKRIDLWNYYYNAFSNIQELELAKIPDYAKPNGHIFYIKTKDNKTREKLRLYLKKKGVDARTHFIPLHSSPYGLGHTQFIGEDKYTTAESNKLLRLPMHYFLEYSDIDYIKKVIIDFFKNHA